jgi:hypothetical protein
MSKNSPFITDEQILLTYSNLQSMRKAAESLQVSRGRVRLLLYKNGIKPSGSTTTYNNTTQRYPESIQLEIMRRHNDEGWSIKELRDEFGGSQWAIQSAIFRNGGQTNPGITTKKNFDTRQIAEIIERYLAGESQFEIAISLQLSQAFVSTLLRSSDIETRSTHLAGEKHPNWNGGVHIDGGGYRKVKIFSNDPLKSMRSKSGHVAEHRLVMARHLGRLLNQSETVHHINGDKLDNRIENLQLRQGKHGKGVTMRCNCCGSIDISAISLSQMEAQIS